KLAKEITRLGVKHTVLKHLLPDLPRSPASAPRPEEPVTRRLTQKEMDEAQEHLAAYVRRQVLTFYGEWNDRAYRQAFGEFYPSADVDTTIEQLVGTFNQDLADWVKNHRGDETDEALVRQQIWEVILELLDHYGFGLFHHLGGLLDAIVVNDA